VDGLDGREGVGDGGGESDVVAVFDRRLLDLYDRGRVIDDDGVAGAGGGHGHAGWVVGPVGGGDESNGRTVYRYSEQIGTVLKTVEAHRGGFPDQIYPTNTHASSTVASDGQRVFTLFLNRDDRPGFHWVP